MARKQSHPLDETSHAEMETIGKIADRAVSLYAQHDVRAERMDVLMDMMCVHGQIQKLRLADLLVADDFNFLHDVGGINRHLDREHYLLTDHFSPRFSVRAEPA